MRARSVGFVSVTRACEPTGHRWRVLDQFAAQRGLALVCVQPLLVYRAREAEDLTFDKSDPKGRSHHHLADRRAATCCMSRSEPMRCGRGCGIWARLAGCT